MIRLRLSHLAENTSLRRITDRRDITQEVFLYARALYFLSRFDGATGFGPCHVPARGSEAGLMKPAVVFAERASHVSIDVFCGLFSGTELLMLESLVRRLRFYLRRTKGLVQPRSVPDRDV